jgi:hypothetical protein
MITFSEYIHLKKLLLDFSNEVKKTANGDKPLIRQSINDYCDYLFKNSNIKDHQKKWLSNYVCTLHPKD